MHILILDGDGKLTGTPGSVLEKFLFVSKASDARGVQGETVYYRDVIKNNSQYIYWGSHEVASVMDVDSGANGSIGLSLVYPAHSTCSSRLQVSRPTKHPLVARSSVPQTTQPYVMHLQGGVDGYTLSRSEILGSYDLIADRETVDVDYILMGPSMADTSRHRR